jgi:hypothetical protein
MIPPFGTPLIEPHSSWLGAKSRSRAFRSAVAQPLGTTLQDGCWYVGILGFCSAPTANDSRKARSGLTDVRISCVSAARPRCHANTRLDRTCRRLVRLCRVEARQSMSQLGGCARSYFSFWRTFKGFWAFRARNGYNQHSGRRGQRSTPPPSRRPDRTACIKLHPGRAFADKTPLSFE